MKPKSHTSCFWEVESMGEWENWTSTLPNELPLWELESQWTPKFSESNFRGQNTLDWRFPYIIEKPLEHRCLKWACMTHLDIWNTSYGQKKGKESNLAIWLPTIQSLCVQVACDIPLESYWQRLQLCFRPHLNQRSTNKVMALQSYGSPNFGNFEIPTWESRDKMPFRC